MVQESDIALVTLCTKLALMLGNHGADTDTDAGAAQLIFGIPATSRFPNSSIVANTEQNTEHCTRFHNGSGAIFEHRCNLLVWRNL